MEKFGEEFNNISTLSQAGLRKLYYLAAIGSGAVNTDYRIAGNFLKSSSDPKSKDDKLYEMFQLVMNAREAHQQMLDDIDELIEDSRKARIETERRLREMREDAIERGHVLDGEALFLSRDGKTVYTESGRKLSKAEASKFDFSGIEKGGHAEDYFEYKRRSAELDRIEREALELKKAARRGDLDPETLKTQKDKLTQLEADLEKEAPELTADELDIKSATITHTRSGLGRDASLSSSFVGTNEPAAGQAPDLDELINDIRPVPEVRKP